MITNATDFIKYFGGVRRRTMIYFSPLPDHYLDWVPTNGRFTCSDLIHHLMASEEMYVTVCLEDR